jgi:hypothetical protein
MSFNFLNQSGSDGGIQQFTPIDTFIDPVSKIRVSNPSNLIDTDFEYGLQPTKWETVEIINNTPAFFSKGGDTTIPDITGITTNSGTREITVTTSFPHNLAVGIPIRVSGTKSVTADGSYIINATPTLTTFTYLSRANQPDTVSIFDLYSSIITGEFFQGSQISISDAEGMVTDGVGPTSTITVKTENKHGFGLNTPFYFLNLNSTISQEFESANDTSLSFDPTNSATAQTFDGSNTLLQTPIDLSNSATTSSSQSIVTASNPSNSTFTVSVTDEDWSELKTGDPLYYSVNSGPGYFQDNPRGVVFIKTIQVGQSEIVFSVSSIPDGNPLPVLSNTTGFFQIATQARTFAGNNVNLATQIDITVEQGNSFVFDGGNQGFDGNPETPPTGSAVVVGYTGTTMTVFTSQGQLDYYTGAMIQYSSSGDVASGLQNNTTYFVTSFSAGASPGLYTMSIAEFPDQSPINVSGGSGSQTFSKIGVSIDKDVVHVRNSNFDQFDMLEYTFPIEFVGEPGDEENPQEEIDGNFGADEEKKFYFIIEKFDQHNYKLNPVLGLISPTELFYVGDDAGSFITPTTVVATGFTEPVTYEITSGTLPTGLVFDPATGVISGKPKDETPLRVVVVTATDVNGIQASQSITFQFNEAPILFEFTSATFTSNGRTGRIGPNITEARAGVGNPEWAAEYLNMTVNGYQEWSVPDDGNYRIDAYGPKGGGSACHPSGGGRGARASGIFELEKENVLRILVGQRGFTASGSSANVNAGGGGGGSFVQLKTGPNLNDGNLLVAAGGGAGNNGCGSNVQTFGNSVGQSGRNGGTCGRGGGACGVGRSGGGVDGSGGGAGTSTNFYSSNGGAGYFGNGFTTSRGNPAISFINNGLGGPNDYSNQNGQGGFGGGAAGRLEGGGGGGYSGGAGGQHGWDSSGGGGSFVVTGTPETILSAGVNNGNAFITITRID